MTQATHDTPTTEQYLDLFDRRADRFTAIVEAVDGGWDAASPCDGWTARDVVGHVIETQRSFLDQHGLDQRGLGDAGSRPAPDLTDPAAAWRTQREQVSAALAVDGVADRSYDGYFGPTTIAATVADFYGWDLVVHGSDVARATGQDWSVTDAEAADLHATADGWGEALHSEGVCGPAVEVPDDASATDRLLARLGRDPRWRPAD